MLFAESGVPKFPGAFLDQKLLSLWIKIGTPDGDFYDVGSAIRDFGALVRSSSETGSVGVIYESKLIADNSDSASDYNDFHSKAYRQVCGECRVGGYCSAMTTGVK